MAKEQKTEALIQSRSVACASGETFVSQALGGGCQGSFDMNIAKVQ